ncbi:MAG: ion channel [Leptolyngbyaceae cyanobacterium bins.59]|nr:ion channel [Leptolyngbyaceae cyanobacterium bins.59]
MSQKPSPPAYPRFINRDGRSTVVRVGDSYIWWTDPYHLLLTLSWPALLGVILLLFLGSNALFALAYLIGEGNINNAEPGSFIDAFSFSVQTMATIGYGAMHPATVYADILVTIESLVGLLGVAMATGLMFARFSIPTARVLFSNVAVIASHNGVPTLMFRAANQRHNQIVEAQLRATLIRDEVSKEGLVMRRLHDLRLVRSRTPIFALTWTVMHTIDEHSPLYGATPDSLRDDLVEIIVTLTGLDATVSQTIHARHSFVAQEILFDHAFVDILTRSVDGRGSINYKKFHEVQPIDLIQRVGPIAP